TADLRSFVVEESVDQKDRNGDGDKTDLVVTLRDRTTGLAQPLGAPPVIVPPACGVTPTPVPEGRPVVSINQPPFKFPAVAVEGDLLAFLESETGQNNCDENGNGSVFETILRVFRRGMAQTPTEVTGTFNRPADAAPVINGRSLAISGGRVFFRA